MESIKDFLIEEKFVLIGSGLFSKTLIDHYGFPIVDIWARREAASNTWTLSVFSKELLIKDTTWGDWIETVDEFKRIYDRNSAIFLFLINHDFHLNTETREQLVWKGGLGKEEITMKYKGDFWKCCIKDYSGIDYCINVVSFEKFKQFLKDHDMLDLFLIMKTEYIQDLIGKGYEETGLDLYSKTLFDHRKEPIINIEVGYDYRDSSWSLSVSPSKFLFTDLDWDSIGSYDDIWKIYNKELAILIFLIDYDFYLLPKQPYPTMIWKGRFSNEQINMSLDSYNLWECSIKNFVGEEKKTKITSLDNLKQFFKDNEMLDIL